jgi:CRISPR-associated protein (TIGR03986 family)
MADEVAKGILHLSKKGSVQVKFTSKKGKPVDSIPPQSELSQTLLHRLKDFDGKDVEFELVNGQPKKVREVGGTFIPPQGTGGNGGRDRGRSGQDKGGSGRGGNAGQGRSSQNEKNVPRTFHNPYNFIPAPPRNTNDPDLGDQCPIDQGEFLPDRYSGSIRVRMTAETPLLVPDTEKMTEKQGHKTFPLRMDAEGRPLLPASSIRGMLRSAYEAVTNSRFGRFSSAQHCDRLAFRMDASEGLKLIPARIENGQIRLLTGTSDIKDDGRPNGPMYAAWLPRYSNGRIDRNAVEYKDGNLLQHGDDDNLPQHGDEVVCWVEKMKHSGKNFHFWRVRKIARAEQSLGDAPEPMRRIRGWVCITNANIDRKHDERVFFVDESAAPGPFRVTVEHQQKWQELIQNYQSLHEDDLKERSEKKQRPDAYLGREPGQTAWSRHVYTREDLELKDGTLCYVRLNSDQSGVEALFPVMISRELYPTSPWALLDPSLRPATAINQLSPADRVFGWVRVDAEAGVQRNERVAARGLLRVSPVRCLSNTADAVEQFAAPGVPLAILAAPKPQQGRFYVAQSTQGEAQLDGLSKREAGYATGKGLRGRKVYPHQSSLPDGHWENPMKDRTQQANGSHYQEYRRPDGENQRDKQNRSILGWVKPGAAFTFDLHVQNLTAVELGALLWMLTLPEGHFFRFGGGKPLGFGSVRLELGPIDVRTGEALRKRYDTWHDVTPPADPRTDAIQAFKDAMARAYPPKNGSFDDIAFIRAFLVACCGHSSGLPTHYPRATEKNGQPGPPSPDGESFKWFVANERKDAKYALQDLAHDTGLPTLQKGK